MSDVREIEIHFSEEELLYRLTGECQPYGAPSVDTMSGTWKITSLYRPHSSEPGEATAPWELRLTRAI